MCEVFFLLQCVLGGNWIVMEDVDFAPPDVVSEYVQNLSTRLVVYEMYRRYAQCHTVYQNKLG